MTESIYKNPFQELAYDIEQGMNGTAVSVPIGMKKLGKYANIRKKILTLLFSSTGAGKSSLADTAYILNPYDYIFSKQNTTGIKMKTILFSMERAKKYRIAKWIVRKVFKEEGVRLPLPKLLGWWEEKLTHNEHDLFLQYEDYINSLLEEVDIYEGPRTPSDFYRIVKTKFEENGHYEKIDEHKEIYIPNDENVIWNIVYDHGNLTKPNKEYNNKKSAIDAACEMAQGFRDKESAHIVWVAQVNRDASNPMRQKQDDMELTLDDVKASGDVGDAADLALSLFDALKYRQSSKTGYDPTQFVDKEDGSKFFRSVTVCKSSYGADDVRVPLGFNGFCGDFAELPRKKDLSDHQLQELIKEVTNGNYFINR